MSLLGSLTVSLLGNMGGLRDSLRQSVGEVEKFQQGMNKVGQGLSSVGSSLTQMVTVPLAAVGGASIKAASNFESAFAGVRKTVDATEAEFAEFKQGIRDMANLGPTTAAELATIAEAAGQLGIKNEALLSFTSTMSDLGVATNMASEEAATALARLANITKMPQENFDRLGASIVALGNNYATTESEITEMALRLAGAGAQVGMSEADILGLAAALSSVGIEAEMGGSAISRVMVRMQVAATTGLGKVDALAQQTGLSLREMQLMADNNSKEFKKMADSLGMTQTEMKNIIKAGVDLKNFSAVAGMTSDQFRQAFEQDAVGALGAFINGLGGAEAAGDSAINMLQEMGITEIRLRDSLLRAGNASELFAGAIGLSNTAWEENTALTNEAAQRYATFDSQMQMFKNRLTDIGITLGDVLMPMVLSLTDAVQPFIDQITAVATQFAALDPASQQMIVVIAAVAAAIGPLLVILGQVVISMSALVPLFAALTGPVGLVVAGIAGLVAGLVYLYQTSETVRNIMNQAWESIKSVALAAWGAISAFVMEQINKIKTFWDENGSQILKAVETVFKGIKKVIEFIMPAVKLVIQIAWNAIKDVISGALDIIMGAIKIFSGLFTGDWSKMWEGIKQLLGGAVDFILGLMTLTFLGGLRTMFMNLLKTGVSLMKGMGEGIIGAFKSLYTGGVNLISNMVRSVISFFTNMVSNTVSIFNQLRAFGASIWSSLSQAIVNTAKGIWTGVKNNFQLMLTSIKNIFGTIQMTIEKIWKGVMTFFKGINLSEIGKNIIQGLINGIGSMASAAVEKARDVAESIGNTIKNFFGIHSPSRLTTEYGKNISQGLANGITAESKKAEEAAKKSAEKVAKAAEKETKRIATTVQKQFKSAFDNVTYRFKMGELDTSGYIKALQTVKNQYAQTTAQVQKVSLAIKKAQETQTKAAEKSAKAAAKAIQQRFAEALSAVQYKYKMGELDTSGYIKALEGVKAQYAKTADQARKVSLEIKKTNDKQAKDAIAAAKKQFEASKTYIQGRAQANEISLQQELALWEKVQARYKVGTKERLTVDKEVNRVRAALDKEAFETSKTYIDSRVEANEMSLAAELEAWERVQARYKVGSEERAAADKQVLEVRKEMYKQLQDASDAYLEGVKEVNANVEAEEKRLNEVYAKAVEDRANSISSFSGLFDEVTEKADVVGADLLKNLQDQVNYLETWSASVEKLAARGIDEGLLEELRQMGPKAAPELAALNTLTDQQLTDYETLWREKTEKSRAVAIEELQGLRTDTDEQITLLNTEATTKLDALKETFDTKVKEIRYGAVNQFNVMKMSMPEIGKQTIQGLMNGLDNMKGPLMTKAKELADSVSGTIRKALDIHSPSRVMFALGQYIAEGLAKGIGAAAGAAEKAAAAMASGVSDAAAVDLSGFSGRGAAFELPDLPDGMKLFGAAEVSEGTVERTAPDYIQTNLYLDGKKIAEAVSEPLFGMVRGRGRGEGQR